MKKAVLREDMMALTQEVTQAMVLGQMLYWTKTLDKVNDWLFEENKRLAEVELPQHEYNYGWIYKSAREMREDLMNAFSEDAIQRAFSALVTKGVFMKRHNPIVRYDRKLQYRIDIIFLRRLLKDRGYEMTDFQLATIPQEAAFIPQGAVSITQGAETITETITKITNKENLLTSLKEELESSAVASHSSVELNQPNLFPTENTANAKESFATAQRNDPPTEANAKTTAARKKSPPTNIPTELDTPEFNACWNEFLQHRKEKKTPMTPTAQNNMFRKFTAWGVENAVVAIDTAISNGWTGVFEPKQNKFNSKPEKFHNNNSF